MRLQVEIYLKGIAMIKCTSITFKGNILLLLLQLVRVSYTIVEFSLKYIDDDISLDLRQNFWFIHEGAPAHFTIDIEIIQISDFHIGRLDVEANLFVCSRRRSSLSEVDPFSVAALKKYVQLNGRIIENLLKCIILYCEVDVSSSRY